MKLAASSWMTFPRLAPFFQYLASFEVWLGKGQAGRGP